MSNDTALREHLVELLHGGHAHATFDQVVRGFPFEKTGVRPRGAPHSAWELLEHMRIAQHDILQFSTSADYVSPKWPEGYWPNAAAPANENQWRKSVRAFRDDLAAFEALVRDPKQDLYKPFPWGDGQTLLREALLIADHNSHHLGQFLLMRRMVGAWPK
jgi:uncharacterized damage-inducible protein DinB